MDRFGAWIEKDEVRRFRWQPVTKTEWRYATLLALGISLFYLLPYLYAYLVCPEGKYYLGILENVRDQNSYFMWMKQISQGNFLMKNLYTSTPHEGVLFNLYYFTATLPNLIMGSVGNGKGLDFVEQNLALLGCKEEREPGANARRLAIWCAATVLCGELSLMAAQTNPGELMRSHLSMER